MFGRKHRFGLLKQPQYRETFVFNEDRKIFIALTLKFARINGWRKINSDPINLEFRTTEKWSSNSLIVIKANSNSEISILSETIAEQRWDFGKNYVRVRDFKKGLIDLLDQLTEIEKRNILNTEVNLLGYYDYREPHSFKNVIEIPTLNKAFILSYCGLIIASLGVAFGYLKYLDLFVLFTREMIFAFCLWFAIYFGAKHGKIRSYKFLKRISFISVFIFYVLQFVVDISLSLYSIADSIDMVDYLRQESLAIKNEFFHRIGQKLLIAALMAGLIGHFFFSNLKLSHSKLMKNEISDEILTYADYLVAKGEDNYQIKNNLTKKGITDYRLHNQILEVIRPNKETLS